MPRSLVRLLPGALVHGLGQVGEEPVGLLIGDLQPEGVGQEPLEVMRVLDDAPLVADRPGRTTAYACHAMADRGELIISPGTEVYSGMVVGERNRPIDMNVNIVKEKKLTNMRQSSGDILIPLIPHKQMSMEQALEFCREDECMEVTPATVRIRKVNLDQTERGRAASRAKKGN